jgi:NAD+ synthase (glutamine-hydrolysing)
MALRVAVAQCAFPVGAIEANAQRVLEWARRALAQGAQLVVFPELALTGYPPEDLLLRHELMARVDAALDTICRAALPLTIVFGAPQRRDTQLINAALVVDHGQLRCVYAKQALPNYSVFDEKRYFVSGNEPGVFVCGEVHVGLTVCEDIWWPEPAAIARAAGAQLIVNINASPYHLDKVEERRRVVAARAAAVRCPIVYANVVGGQDELVFDGASFAVNADGTMAWQGAVFEESLTLLTLRQIASEVWGFEPTTSVSLPCEDESIYRALVVGVRDYVTRNGFKGAVLGLSGGIDSALTLAIAVDALGADCVTAVMMPSRYTADMSVEDAREQAQRMGCRFIELSIEHAFASFLQTLAPIFVGLPADTTEENIQARCRGVLLMAISNKSRSIVLTTGNKSEMSVGYATLYGDMAGGYAPIKDIMKMRVYQLAEYRNVQGEVIPRRVIERAPSAELAPNQRDQDSLPPYPVLDAILALYIEQDKSVDDIVAQGFGRETVERVVKMVDRNEYKRRQAPPGVRITRRAFGKDRRYPITSSFGA